MMSIMSISTVNQHFASACHLLAGTTIKHKFGTDFSECLQWF